MRGATVTVALVAATSLWGCGGNRGSVFQPIDAATPPSSNLRADVFLLRAVSTCAVGPPCASGAQNGCFFVTAASGQTTTFDPNGLVFVSPDDPKVQEGPQAICFRLAMDDALVARVDQLMATLRDDVFRLSGGDVNLDVRLHQVPAINAGFSTFYTGLFLEPQALEGVGLGMVNRDTDMVFALTGFEDPEAGLRPNPGDHCTGTNGFAKGVLGGSTYSWIGLTEACARPGSFLRTFVVQLYLGMRDMGGIPDLYLDGYPQCGHAERDTTLWFPWFEDCTSDPDAPACGATTCTDPEAFDQHLLTAHWRHGFRYEGNHCADGRMDFGETGVDTGGVCDLIGH